MLPSIRNLAAQLTINPNTVAQAYKELTNDGLITTRQGQGTFVNAFTSNQSDSDTRRLQLLTDLLTHTYQRSLSMGFSSNDVRDHLNAILAHPHAHPRHLIVITKTTQAATRYHALLEQQLGTKHYTISALTFDDVNNYSPAAQTAFSTGYFIVTLSLYVRELETLLTKKHLEAEVIPATVDITQDCTKRLQALTANQQVNLLAEDRNLPDAIYLLLKNSHLKYDNITLVQPENAAVLRDTQYPVIHTFGVGSLLDEHNVPVNQRIELSFHLSQQTIKKIHQQFNMALKEDT